MLHFFGYLRIWVFELSLSVTLSDSSLRPSAVPENSPGLLSFSPSSLFLNIWPPESRARQMRVRIKTSFGTTQHATFQKRKHAGRGWKHHESRRVASDLDISPGWRQGIHYGSYRRLDRGGGASRGR